MDQICKACKYWEKDRCHRYPPVVISENPSFTSVVCAHPVTDAEDWCGEFAKQE